MSRAALLLGGLLTSALAAVAAFSPGAAPVTLLYPPNGCATTAARVQVICVGPRATREPGVQLDGKPLRLERAEPAPDWYPRAIRRGAVPRPALLDSPDQVAVWFGTAVLTPGKHVLVIAGKTTRIQRIAARKATKLPRLAAHPPVASHPCGGCHNLGTGGGAATLGEPSVPETCQRCHTPARLQTIHKHIMDPLKRCWTCHDPHGATRPDLLTDDPKRLCSRCHALGHTKP